MNNYFNTSLGRFRLLAILEGTSLLVLVFIAVPLKYIDHDPQLVKSLGPIHGVLFLLFIMNTLKTATELSWSFKRVTWKVMLACIIPFGTFYIDRNILRPIQRKNKDQ